MHYIYLQCWTQEGGQCRWRTVCASCKTPTLESCPGVLSVLGFGYKSTLVKVKERLLSWKVCVCGIVTKFLLNSLCTQTGILHLGVMLNVMTIMDFSCLCPWVLCHSVSTSGPAVILCWIMTMLWLSSADNLWGQPPWFWASGEAGRCICNRYSG